MNIHFVGCEGVSMRALARIMKSKGHKVSGSDTLLSGHDAEFVLGADLVVYTSAVGENNVEVVEARRRGIKVIERAEFLGHVSRDYKNVIAVSGCHGKTTTTGFLQEIFISQEATVHIGGSVLGHEQSIIGGNRFFITEACEYRRSFLSLRPALSVILNIELDHPDYYKDFADYESAFISLSHQSKMLVINGDDSACEGIRRKVNVPTVTFGMGENNTFRAVNVTSFNEGFSFDILKNGMPFLPNVNMNLHGSHNVMNALAACTAAHLCGLSPKMMREGIEKFQGVKRRFEYITVSGGTRIFSDYAHHPSEIKTTIETAKKMGANKVTVVFEPHTYSRTKCLKGEFIHALQAADRIVVTPIFPAREDPIEGVTSQALVRGILNSGTHAVAMNTFFEACDYIFQTKTDGEIVVFTGAGDIEKAAEFFKKNLCQNCSL